MRTTPTKKSSAAIPFEERVLARWSRGLNLARWSRGLVKDQRGQGFLEYVLVLLVVLGMIFVLARPVIAKLEGKFEKGLKGGIFKNDPTGAGYYYFPLK